MKHTVRTENCQSLYFYQIGCRQWQLQVLILFPAVNCSMRSFLRKKFWIIVSKEHIFICICLCVMFSKTLISYDCVIPLSCTKWRKRIVNRKLSIVTCPHDWRVSMTHGKVIPPWGKNAITRHTCRKTAICLWFVLHTCMVMLYVWSEHACMDRYATC